ncbi:MAG: protein kinase [Prevotella sp.]|nr:protein kinase [Prevotella sp.]
MQHLQPNTTLQGGKYKIERMLGQGGFGNTYSGYNTVFDERVAIKEFFMQGINDRDGDTGSVSVSLERNLQQFEEQREKFKKEALRIRKLSNPHIIKVHDLFEENGTVYYVMDFVDGENLAERLKRTGAPFNETEVQNILPQLLDALKTVHDAGIWHLDLKPANILIDKTGNVKLIDFGASKQFNAQKGGATTSTAISYTNGYAPREQMEQNYDKFGPWTDFYALGATLYTLLTNKRPPLPTDIDDDISEDKHLALPLPNDVSKEMKSNILWLMQTNRNKRPQSIDEFISRMKEVGKPAPVSVDDAKKDSMISSEETIIAGNENEETIIDAPSIKKPIEEPRKVVSQTKHKYSSSTDNNNSDGHSKGVALMILATFFLIIFIAYFSNSKSGIYSSPPVPAEDSTIVDTAAVDTAVVGDFVENIVYDSPLGKYTYTGWAFEGTPDGEGEARFKDGRYYKGSFDCGSLSGDNAFFRYPNGDEFKGTFKDNAFYKGTYTIAEDGSYFTGTFKNGQPDKGTWYDKNGKKIE